MSKIAKKMNQILMAVIAKLTPSCDIITHKISKSMDSKVSFRDKLEIRIHLLNCKLCLRYRDQLLSIQAMLHRYVENIENGEIMTDVTLSENARNRIRSKLDKEKNK